MFKTCFNFFISEIETRGEYDAFKKLSWIAIEGMMDQQWLNYMNELKSHSSKIKKKLSVEILKNFSKLLKIPVIVNVVDEFTSLEKFENYKQFYNFTLEFMKKIMSTTKNKRMEFSLTILTWLGYKDDQ